MKHILSRHRLQHLLRQRNMTLVACLFLLMSNAILCISVFSKDAYVVVVPPETKQAFQVSRNRVSATYLEEMAVFMGGLFLSVSPSSAAYQRDVILRYVTPESYGQLRAQLLEDERRLKQNNVSTVFRPIEVKVDPINMQVELTGDLMSYVGDKRISQVRDAYTFTFKLVRGELQIKTFTCPRSINHD